MRITKLKNKKVDLHSRTLPSCCDPLYIMLYIHLTELLCRFSFNKTETPTFMQQFFNTRIQRNDTEKLVLFTPKYRSGNNSFCSHYKNYWGNCGRREILKRRTVSHHFHNFPDKPEERLGNGTRFCLSNRFDGRGLLETLVGIFSFLISMWVFTRVLDRLNTRRDMRAARRAASDYEIKTWLDYKTYEPNFFIRVRTFRTRALTSLFMTLLSFHSFLLYRVVNE